MLKRIFEHYEGDVKELSCLKVSSLKAIIDQENDDIILIWIGVNDDLGWYRIFIDEYYCGIDYFEEDLSDEDEDTDESIICVDYNCIYDDIIVNAKVESSNVELGDLSILLTIEFLSRKKLLLYCYDTESECKLEIV